MEGPNKKENPIKKALKKTAFYLGTAGILAGSAGKSTEAFSQKNTENVKPIIVASFDDPRLQEYRDSLRLYNISQKSLEDFAKHNRKYGKFNYGPTLTALQLHEDIVKTYGQKTILPAGGGVIRYGEYNPKSSWWEHGVGYYYVKNNRDEKIKPSLFKAMLYNGDKYMPQPNKHYNYVGLYKKPTGLVFLEGTKEAEAAKKQQELKNAGFKIDIDGDWGKKSQATWDEYQRSKVKDVTEEEKKSEVQPEKNGGVISNKYFPNPEVDTEKPDWFMMPDGKKYTYEELLRNYPMMKSDSVFKANFPGRERPKNQE